MPRIYTSASDPLDFCRKHFPRAAAASAKYGNVGDGPDGRGNCFGHDAEHPDYSDGAYHCEVCKTPLTDDDN